MLGEIRDRDTLEHAIEYADTGHLCIATFHAHNTRQALERIISMYEEDKRDRLLQGLSINLQAILNQKLIMGTHGSRVPAWELLRKTPRVSDILQRGNLHELFETIEKNVNDGMQTFDQTLYSLYSNGLISPETTLKYADSVGNMRLNMRLQTQQGNGPAR